MSRSELLSSLGIFIALLLTVAALFAMLIANSFLLGALLRALFDKLSS